MREVGVGGRGFGGDGGVVDEGFFGGSGARFFFWVLMTKVKLREMGLGAVWLWCGVVAEGLWWWWCGGVGGVDDVLVGWESVQRIENWGKC